MSEFGALLTRGQVEAWVAERAEVFRQHSELAARLDDLDRKLEAVRCLLPEDTADALFHPETKKPRAEWSFTELVLDVLAATDRGYTPAELRTLLNDDPEVGQKSRRSHNGVSNALQRLAAKDEVSKLGPRYYLPTTLQRIQSGEIVEQVENEDATSFNARMHAAMEDFGRPFVAKDAHEVAKRHGTLSEDLSEQPTRIYSWLSREVFRGRLLKEGSVYYYPSQRDEALAVARSAPTVTGEVAPSPIENVTDLYGKSR
ncbi:MAG: hypothetical protein A3H25_16805 [Sphingomonadales bacterium RIFCSPLOWO2_12_FULL_63_15]|nr:MAG: hypothetical protein A3H25_16805 [Sphingomonadales bacterium RIFCSPLOWO2_12_FULL_63_15]